jgi:type II secretory ATPase GspE/PulE/Tfp pilus assembly ATPase PilB-like protein
VGSKDEVEHLVVAPHTLPAPIHNVGVRLGRSIVTRVADAETIAGAIDAAYRAASEHPAPDDRTREDAIIMVDGAGDVESELAAAVRDAEQDLLNTSNKAPSVRLVDLILFEALQRSASDVHVQPLKDRTLVRYRLDGALHTTRELPAALASSVVSRVKVMARMDVAERRSPQDGRATVSIGGSGKSTSGQASGSSASRHIDLRVSTLPSTYGERVVLRLLDPTRSPHLSSFEALGMPERVREAYLAQVTRTNGIVLSTGPTGSGKTTTLYATLSWISANNHGSGSGGRSGKNASGISGCELNMMTIEDPVEYDLSASAGGQARVGTETSTATRGLAISQTQVDPKKGVTFATGLRHILRQDPDVIMVGEVRDPETARIAVQASLTGHLVLSTLHTNDAPSAVVRLIDLGVEPFLVSSSLAAVLAQRLVRMTHAPCRGEGCEVCLGTGYKGRVGVYELLVMDAELRRLTGSRASAADLKQAAMQGGMVPLREAGAALVRAGKTTPQEVARVIETLEEVET